MKDYFWQHYDEEKGVDYLELLMDSEKFYCEERRRIIDSVLPENANALDIGCAGMINYDYSRLNKLTCADLQIPTTTTLADEAANVSFVVGNILDMNQFKDNTYDVVIVQDVIHHLAEKSLRATKQNAAKAISECLRVCVGGGYVVICEATVKNWFEKAESMLFPVMRFITLRILKFDIVYQYAPSSLREIIEQSKGCKLREMKPINVGKTLSICGIKLPTRFLPFGATYYLIYKLKDGET